MEHFIFDTFPGAQRVQLVEVLRSEEFSPVKNAPGVGSSDSPDTARAHVLALHKRYAATAGSVASFAALKAAMLRRWAEAAGASVSAEGVEVSPLLSYAGEDLEALCSSSAINSADQLLQM